MRLRRLDALLLGLTLPVALAWIGRDVIAVSAGQRPVIVLPIRLEAVPDPGGHPIVRWIRPAWDGGRVLRPGDTLLRLGDEDLAGATLIGLVTRVFERARDGTTMPLTLRRGDTVMDVRLDAHRPHAIEVAPAWLTITALAVVACGVLIVLRAPGARAARPLGMALVFAQFLFGVPFPGPAPMTHAYLVLVPLGAVLAAPCMLQGLLLLVEETAPRTRFGLWWPWLFAPFMLSIFTSQLFDVPFPGDVVWRWLEPLAWSSFVLAMMAVLARGFRHAGPVGRRRVKWVLYGCYLLYAPAGLQAMLVLLGQRTKVDDTAFLLTSMLVPACLMVAVVRHNLLDIDRLISVTASYTVLGVLFLGAVLAGFPRVAAAASGGLGVDPATGQLVLAAVLACVFVPAHARLRPQIDRVFFAQRFALERGVAALLDELSTCDGPETLYACAGERLDRLIRPDSCVVLARTGAAFAPAFVRGGGAPAVFEADGPLVAALGRRSAPLAAEAWRRGRTSSLGPFDRAALETLGAAVVLPVRRRDALVAIVSIGAKRSGDVYTPTDLTLLEAVARKVSDELERFELADIIERGRVMEGALRRYVPAAVTAQLASGVVEPAEREVTILFVDLRGYTTFAETRPAEDVFRTVNRYTEAVSAIARDRGGMVAEFSGDGMMVVFGAPHALAAKERAAVEAGREIIDAVAALPPDGAPRAPLSVGVGIATGRAFVGDVHSAERLIWTAIGNTVNTAARLQQLTRSMEAAMVIDTPTWQGARYVAVDFVRRERTAIRGHAEPQDVWVLASAPVATTSGGS